MKEFILALRALGFWRSAFGIVMLPVSLIQFFWDDRSTPSKHKVKKDYDKVHQHRFGASWCGSLDNNARKASASAGKEQCINGQPHSVFYAIVTCSCRTLDEAYALVYYFDQPDKSKVNFAIVK